MSSQHMDDAASVCTVDVGAKYARLAREHVRLRRHADALNDAAAAERRNCGNANERLKACELDKRKLADEIDGLRFRNEQLSRRVQLAVDAQQQQHNETAAHRRDTGSFRRSKRFLRMVKSKSSHGGDMSNGAAANHNNNEEGGGELAALRDDLHVKIADNERLHTKLYEMDEYYEREMAMMRETISSLTQEMGGMRRAADSTDPSDDHDADGCEQLPNAAGDARPDGADETAGGGVPSHEWLDACGQLDRSAALMRKTAGDMFTYLRQRTAVVPRDCSMGEPLSDACVKYAESLSLLSHSLQCVLERCASLGHLFASMPHTVDARGVSVLAAVDDQFYAQVEAEALRLRDASTAYCSAVDDGFCDLLNAVIGEECSSPWCADRLRDANEAFAERFVRLLRDRLPAAMRCCADGWHAAALCDALDELAACIMQFADALGDKVTVENRVATATKRQRTLNECALACAIALGRQCGDAANAAAKCRPYLRTVCDQLNACRPSAALDSAHNSHAQCDSRVNVATEEPVVDAEGVDSASIERLNAQVASLKLQVEQRDGAIVSLSSERDAASLRADILRAKLDNGNKATAAHCDTGDGALAVDTLTTGYYADKLAAVRAQLQLCTGLVDMWQQECESLLLLGATERLDKARLQGDVDEQRRRVAALQEELECTRRGYEEQLAEMSKHLADTLAHLDPQ